MGNFARNSVALCFKQMNSSKFQIQSCYITKYNIRLSLLNNMKLDYMLRLKLSYRICGIRTESL